MNREKQSGFQLASVPNSYNYVIHTVLQGECIVGVCIWPGNDSKPNIKEERK